MTNGILIACPKTRKAAIVDAPPDSAHFFISRIRELKLDPVMILLTHSHWDHTADVAKLKKQFSLPVYVHQADAENLRKPGTDGLPLLMEIQPAEPDEYLEDQLQLKLGELNFSVIHTPGHSPGGVCFYFPDEKLLISGDTLFQGTIGNLSFPQAEPAKMWDSLEKLAQLPPETRVVPGHGDETQIGKEGWLSQAKEYFGG